MPVRTTPCSRKRTTWLAARHFAGIGDRVIRNTFTNAWHGRDQDVLGHRQELAAQVRAATEQGDGTIAPTRAGSAAGLIDAIEPAGEIVRRLVAEAERVLRERPGQVVR